MPVTITAPDSTAGAAALSGSGVSFGRSSCIRKLDDGDAVVGELRNARFVHRARHESGWNVECESVARAAHTTDRAGTATAAGAHRSAHDHCTHSVQRLAGIDEFRSRRRNDLSDGRVLHVVRKRRCCRRCFRETSAIGRHRDRRERQRRARMAHGIRHESRRIEQSTTSDACADHGARRHATRTPAATDADTTAATNADATATTNADAAAATNADAAAATDADAAATTDADAAAAANTDAAPHRRRRRSRSQRRRRSDPEAEDQPPTEVLKGPRIDIVSPQHGGAGKNIQAELRGKESLG